MTELGVVVIGRNEGDRLSRCLRSVVGRGHLVVYVDSGSTDGSVTLARGLGAVVVALDMTTPFTAARARNAGVAHLRAMGPESAWVQFLDGDCELVPEWLDQGRATLQSRTEVAIVSGRLRERDPERSLYNRLADLEWAAPAGETDSCGGVAMARLSALLQVGGFEESAASGEEPELCQRLVQAGWKVLRLDADMGWHDMAMDRFGQWWRRQVRGGYGALDIVRRFGHSGGFRGFRRQVRGAWVWGAGWPTCVALAGLLGTWFGSTQVGIAAALLMVLTLPAQVLRMAWKHRHGLPDVRVALSYGTLTMIAKWAHLVGHLVYLHDQARGRPVRLIEHKRPSPQGT